MRYAIVIEKTRTNYTASNQDLLGYVANGTTFDETGTLICEPITFHSKKNFQANEQPAPPSV